MNLNKFFTFAVIVLIAYIAIQIKYFETPVSELFDSNLKNIGTGLFLIAAAVGGNWWFYHIEPNETIHGSSMKDISDAEAKMRFERMMNVKGDGTAKMSTDKRRKRSLFGSDNSGNIFYGEKEKKK